MAGAVERPAAVAPAALLLLASAQLDCGCGSIGSSSFAVGVEVKNEKTDDAMLLAVLPAADRMFPAGKMSDPFETDAEWLGFE